MAKQVIQFNLDGTIEGLDHKRKGFDLRTLGIADIKRVSEILWNESEQVWQIQILQGRYADRLVTNLMWNEEVIKSHFKNSVTTYYLSFKDYEDAVDAEVTFLNAVRTNYKGL